MPTVAEDLQWALKQFKSKRQQAYSLYNSYYDGNQRLAFATEKFRDVFGHVFKEFAENLCSPVVDALSDRLEITGFKSSEAEVVIEEEKTEGEGPKVEGGAGLGEEVKPAASYRKVTTKDPLGVRCLEIWDRNRMDLKAGEVHTESLKLGDAYAIVWPNDEQEAEIWPQVGYNCCIRYDANIQGKILVGAKRWWDDVTDKWMINLYYPEMIVKFIQKGTSTHLAENINSFEVYERVNNPYGRVPLFHFPNRRARAYGISELRDVIPIQDGLNKSCMDMIIAMEFASFKQRYVIGWEIPLDEVTGEPVDPTAKNYGVDRLLAIGDVDAKVGQFDATDLTQFLKVQEKFWASAARISGTPLHYFFITEGDFPSGEAMKSAEARFVKKIKDRQTGFGNVWEDVLKFCLRIEESTDTSEIEIESEWVTAAPRSESEVADTAVKKKAVGVSRSQILRELGYDEETIIRMLMESDADAVRSAQLKGAQQNGSKEGQEEGQKVPAKTGPGKGVPR